MSKYTIVPVIGLPRGGTSCTAGVIHLLGVSMGPLLRPPDKANPRGYFEDDVLFWATDLRMKSDMRIRLLRRYANQRMIRYGETMIGMKISRFCLMIPELVRAFAQLKIVVPERDMEEVIVSQRNTRMWPGWGRRRLHSRMITHRDQREADIAKYKPDVLRLDYHDTVLRPRLAIDRIIAFLGITPNQKQIQAAMEFVSPELWHHGRVR